MDNSTGQRRPTISPTVEFRVLDDLSSVVVDSESGQAHALTPVGTAIFERCDGEMSVDQIVSELTEIFECTADQARTDVSDFLNDLESKGLIR